MRHSWAMTIDGPHSPAPVPDDRHTDQPAAAEAWADPGAAAPPLIEPLIENATERVSRGMLFALPIVPAAAIVTVLTWRAGALFVAITAFGLSAGAAKLYELGAGAPPRKGAAAVLTLIVLGLVTCFFCVVGTDAATYYDQHATELARVPKADFMRWVMFDGEVLRDYTSIIVRFVIFGALGSIGTIIRMFARRPRQ
jgi:hypothetical protein